MRGSKRSNGVPELSNRKQIVWRGLLPQRSAVMGEYLKRKAEETDPLRRAGPVITYVLPPEEIERRYGKPGEFKETRERVWNYQR